MVIDMVEFLTEPLQYAFMVRGLLATALVGVVCAVVGTYVVLRGMAFFGDALAHAILPGIAVGYLYSGGNYSSLFWWAMLTAILSTLGINAISRNTKIKEDTAIGIIFAGMFALGYASLLRAGMHTRSDRESAAAILILRAKALARTGRKAEARLEMGRAVEVFPDTVKYDDYRQAAEAGARELEIGVPVGRRAEVLARLVAAAQGVIGGALLGVGKDRVGLVDLLHPRLGAGLLRQVRVMLARQLAIGLLDLGDAGGTAD